MELISSGQKGLSIRRSKGIKHVHPKKLHVNCRSPLKSSTISTLAPLDQIADAPERTSPSRSCSGGSICTLEQVFVKSSCTNYCQFHTCQYMYIINFPITIIYKLSITITNYFICGHPQLQLPLPLYLSKVINCIYKITIQHH